MVKESGMANDFLASWREDAVVEPGPAGLSLRPSSEGNKSGDKDTALDERHRTVGVSMSPRLRAAAVARAKALGLPFSRYVAWCVEAELEGRPPQARFARRPGPMESAKNKRMRRRGEKAGVWRK